MLGIRKLITSAYHSMVLQMLWMVVNERENDWDEWAIAHVEYACNDSVSAATGLVPHEVRLGRLPCLPLTVIERQGASGHQSLECDQLGHYGLAQEGQPLSYPLVREHQAFASSRIARAIKDWSDVLHKKSLYSVGSFVCS